MYIIIKWDVGCRGLIAIASQLRCVVIIVLT